MKVPPEKIYNLTKLAIGNNNDILLDSNYLRIISSLEIISNPLFDCYVSLYSCNITTSEDEYIMQRVKIYKTTLLTYPVTYVPYFLLLNMIYSFHLRKSYEEILDISTKLQFENIP